MRRHKVQKGQNRTGEISQPVFLPEAKIVSRLMLVLVLLSGLFLASCTSDKDSEAASTKDTVSGNQNNVPFQVPVQDFVAQNRKVHPDHFQGVVYWDASSVWFEDSDSADKDYRNASVYDPMQDEVYTTLEPITAQTEDAALESIRTIFADKYPDVYAVKVKSKAFSNKMIREDLNTEVQTDQGAIGRDGGYMVYLDPAEVSPIFFIDREGTWVVTNCSIVDEKEGIEGLSLTPLYDVCYMAAMDKEDPEVVDSPFLSAYDALSLKPSVQITYAEWKSYMGGRDGLKATSLAPQEAFDFLTAAFPDLQYQICEKHTWVGSQVVTIVGRDSFAYTFQDDYQATNYEEEIPLAIFYKDTLGEPIFVITQSGIQIPHYISKAVDDWVIDGATFSRYGIVCAPWDTLELVNAIPKEIAELVSEIVVDYPGK